VQGYISIDPWSTATEAMKLAAYIAAAILALLMSQRASRAGLLLDALIAIGSFYSLYAVILRAIDVTQFQIFYAVPAVGKLISGPFVLHNSFATFCGLTTLCAVGRLFQSAGRIVIPNRGWRVFLVSLSEFLSGGRGRWLLAATIVNFSMLLASASRAGFASTMCGLMAMGLLSAVSLKRRSHRRVVLLTSVAVGVLLLVLIGVSGGTLLFRLEMPEGEIPRIVMWQAGERMIADAPFLGLGLGTYEDAYPLYANHAEHFIVDKAHNDYIELAAGLGLPAAACWLLAMGLLVGRCLKGVRARRRDGIFPLLAVSASVQVGLHAIMDFSLQMPAVAVFYAAILGMGLAQSFPSSSRERAPRRAVSHPPNTGKDDESPEPFPASRDP
jgi:O-antigen ligase